MPGKYEMCPEWGEYFWDQALNGMSEDREEEGVVISYVSVNEPDIEKYPALSDWVATFPFVKLWEDSRGFVFCEFVKAIPEPSDDDLGAPEGGEARYD